MSFSNSILQINTKTWNKESHGLHDYDAAIYDSQSFEIHRTSALIKEGDKFSVVKASGNSQNRELIATKGGMLALMVECPDGIKVCPSNLDNENQLWFSLDERNQTSRKGHLLKENDVVKIGRTTIVVRQIKSEETSIADIYRSPIFQSIKKEHSTGSVNSIQISSSTDAGSPRNEGSCRLCHSDSQNEENPLISPCNCSDSRKYAHYKCIQEWMRKRSCVLSNQKIIDFNWEKLSCEHCKTGIPLTMTHQGKELMLVPLNDRLSKSYAILEFFSRDNNSTGIFVVGLDVLGKYKIGRGHECDFQIDDNSVSRVHANLTISRGKLYVIDNTSRFGTLVLAKEPFILNNLMKNCWVQCGKTLIEFDLQKPWISFLPCFDSVCNNNCLKNSKAHVKKALKEDPRIEAKLASESDDSKKSPITLL